MNVLEKFGYKLRETSKGFYLILENKITDSLVHFMKDNDIKGLELNYTFGFKSIMLKEIGKINFIEHFKIITYDKYQISDIYVLKNLKTISLNDESNQEINFNSFPNLEYCYFIWREKGKSIFDQTNLKELRIDKYKYESLEQFKYLNNLKTLTISNSRKLNSLSGVERLTNLKHLNLYLLSSLSSIDQLIYLKNLKELEIDTCNKVNSFSVIGGLKKLEKLYILNCKEINSINWIESLIFLESFLFFDSTNIKDGNLNPILNLKKLKNIAFQDRKHYSHSLNELKTYLGISL